MKHIAMSAIIALFLTAAPVAAQTIRVAPETEVARESDPWRFSEPHLAIHPANPNRLLAGVFITWVQGALEETRKHQRCAAFTPRDGGATLPTK